MKIYTATEDYHRYFVNLFEGDDVQVLPNQNDRKGLRMDLLIYTGGEDVYPDFYGRENPGGTWFNRDRDVNELNSIRDYRRGYFKAKKVLGVCRGLQILNVALGGTLYFDIPTSFGQAHTTVHPIRWEIETPFSSYLSEVNSMHHQAVEMVGDSYRYSILAREPQTNVVEVMQWADSILGVQFHPEFFGDIELKQKFASTIRSWILGEISFGEIQRPDRRVYNFNYTTSTENS